MAALGRPVGMPFTGTDQVPVGVRDVDGNALELDDQVIGRGGQGTVYRVRHSRYAVKLINERILRTEQPPDGPGDSLDERLARLRWLPLDGVPIVAPIRSLAAPHVGYTMELLEDTVPIATLCEPPDNDLEAWYARGGGLRRRLLLLARCAGALARLHGRGLVYGDISPGNVLISADRAHDRTWLIDPDNLAVESRVGGPVVGTRLYRAPEIVRRQSGNTPFSDIYSFALLAYQTLRADHPLIGDMVWQSADHEEDVERGLLPWTGHSTDARNRSAFGLAADVVLTRGLTDLFRRTFEDGLLDPVRRPGAGLWAARLSAAADLTVTCRDSRCGQSFYRRTGHCPLCSTAAPETVAVSIREQVPGHVGGRGARPMVLDTPSGYLMLQRDQPRVVTARHARLACEDPDAPVLRLRWRDADSVEVDNIGALLVRRVPPTGGAGRALPTGGRAVERIGGGWRLHFDDDRRIHRLLTFDKPQEGA